MTDYRVNEAADLIGVSPDTVRRWIDDGSIKSTKDESGRVAIDGASLAEFVAERGAASPIEKSDAGAQSRSMRNHFPGIVTAVVSDKVMSQVTVQAGPFRIVSLISTEAVNDLDLKVGSKVVADAKATNVSVRLASEN